MLPPFIIEQIRKREEDRRHYELPQLELPLPEPLHRRRTEPQEDNKRGIVIIELV